jgi:hypothetical protein
VGWQGIRESVQRSTPEDEVGSAVVKWSQYARQLGRRIGVVTVQERDDLGAFSKRDLDAGPASGAVAWPALNEDARTVRPRCRTRRIVRATDDDQHLVDTLGWHFVEHGAD